VTSYVLDSSAVLAFLDSEPGAAIVLSILRSSYISTVNLAEVYSKLIERGDPGLQAFAIVRSAIGQVMPFTEQMAEASGELRPLTRHLGLSLGDRACLALAMALNAEVYTADRIWAELQLPCTIKVIR
jgi:PIN domain nuclease of toxin-antitoxin system